MAKDEQRKPLYVIEVRQFLFGVLASLIAGFAATVFSATPWQVAVVALLAFVGIVLVGVRRRRRVQLMISKILRDPSSSRSAKKALQFVMSELERNASNDELLRHIDLITERRRHPHSALFAPVVELLNQSTQRESSRRLSASYLKIALYEIDAVRVRVAQSISDFVSQLSENSILVLYGYSTTVCDGLILAGRQLKAPIWIIEDLQYGDASVHEHELTAERLKSHSIEATVLPYETVAFSLGYELHDIALAFSGKRIPIPHRARFVGLLGCDAFDDDGTALIPSIVDGRTSESAKFVELFDLTQPSPILRELYVAAECFKALYKIESTMLSTSSPSITPWWVRPMHFFGFAVPFKGTPVTLVAIRSELSGLITEQGVFRAPFGNGSLEPIRSGWREMVTIRSDHATVPSSRHVSRQTRDHSGIRQIFLDFNGVIIRDEGIHFEAFSILCHGHGGNELTWANYAHACLGRTDEEGIANLVRADLLGGNPEEVLFEKDHLYRHLMGDHKRWAQLLSPNAYSVLLRFKNAGFALHIITASSQAFVAEYLAQVGLDKVISPTDVHGAVKYSQRRRVIDELLAASSFSGNETILVDDSEGNLEFGSALGMWTALFGAPTARVAGPPVDFIVTSFTQLAAVLEGEKK